MLRNIKLTIEYDGTDYCGWQIQKSHTPHASRYTSKSIQGTIEKVLSEILQRKIRLIGSGRTDAGVHAQGQVANFKTDSNIPLEKLQKALNALLPGDIVITKTKEVDMDFHSRFYAKSKVYRYTILNRPYPSALLKNRVYFYPYPLDIKLMRDESKVLLGRHDFSAFCASGSAHKNSARAIKKIKIIKENDLLCIDIEADGFLYNMARNIAGTLIEIGRGRFPKGRLRKILLSRSRRLAGPTLPAQGLCLVKVKY
ncbi:MAG: tRNA pseudouridine(38-40) synthase TruA [Candidatus Omnitrophica bacterium]|nr:tRNA pseudouridine(38-40) synthase TruA [Candidatus Omnitrophota bacterium]